MTHASRVHRTSQGAFAILQPDESSDNWRLLNLASGEIIDGPLQVDCHEKLAAMGPPDKDAKKVYFAQVSIKPQGEEPDLNDLSLFDDIAADSFEEAADLVRYSGPCTVMVQDVVTQEEKTFTFER